MQASVSKLLKKDVFGRSVRIDTATFKGVRREANYARPALRWLARRLLVREARALAVLDGIPGVPALIEVTRDRLDRTWIDGEPMQLARPRDPDYFKSAARLLRRLHRHGIAHNDLAKEPNLLVMTNGGPAIIDFQLSTWAPGRGRLFRQMAREDIRHLLKHKRTYCPGFLTEREKRILDNPATLSKIWMKTGKPVYLFVTRRLMGWKDREGAGDRV